jgi:type I restriction enzyme S subunit
MELTLHKYKQTEVGLIPEDWNLENIEDFASITTGGSDTQDRIKDGEYPFYVRSNTIERINKYSFDGEAILTSGDGVGVGKIFHYVTGKFDYHQRVYNIFNYRKDVDGKYLFFQFSTNFYEKVMSMTAKSSVDSVRREMIADMKIPLPPTLKEQKAIATALGDVDGLVSNLDKLIAKKKAIKQGVMQQLLMPDENWVTKTIKEVAIYRRGSFPQPYGLAKWYDDISGMPFVQVVDVGKNKKLKAETKQKISKEGAQMSVFVKKGSVILTIQGSIGRICITQYDAYVDRTLLIFESFKENFNTFFFMISIWLKFQIEKENAPGGIIKTITKEALSSFEISFPNRLEQDKIAKTLEDIDLELEQLESKKAKYQNIKQGMMQELLTGKTRLV